MILIKAVIIISLIGIIVIIAIIPIMVLIQLDLLSNEIRKVKGLSIEFFTKMQDLKSSISRKKNVIERLKILIEMDSLYKEYLDKLNNNNK